MLDTWSLDFLTFWPYDFSKQPPKLPCYIFDFDFDFLEFYVRVQFVIPHGGHGHIYRKEEVICVVQAHKTFMFVLTIALTLAVGLAHKTGIRSSCLLPASQSFVVSIPHPGYCPGSQGFYTFALSIA